MQRVYSAMAHKPGMKFILTHMPNTEGRAVKGPL